MMDAPLYEIIADPHDTMAEGAPLRLCGPVGRELISNIKQEKYANPVEMYRAFFKFFSVLAT